MATTDKASDNNISIANLTLSPEYLSSFGYENNNTESVDTNSLIRLRYDLMLGDSKYFEVYVIDGEKECLIKLRSIRAQAMNIFSDYHSTDHGHHGIFVTRFCKLARMVWESLSIVKNRRSILYLPPIYEGDMGIDEIIDGVIRNLFLRECGLISNFDSSDHTVLGGVEGAGKSTLVKAFAIAAAVLFTRITPIHWNYKTCGITCPHLITPVGLLARFVDAVTANVKELPLKFGTNSWDDSTNDALIILNDRLIRCNILPFMLIDEFQLLYKRDEQITKRIQISYELCSFVRQYGTYCVIAGSTSKMRRLLFRDRDPDSKEDPWHDFADFNSSLFRIHYVTAMRSYDSLSNYISKRYPDWLLTKEECEMLLCRTGGIGRLVNYAYDSWPRVPNIVYHRCEPSVATYLQKSSFSLFYHTLVVNHEKIIESNAASKRLGCIGLPYQTIRAALLNARYHPEKEIEGWVDVGLAYISIGPNGDQKSVQIAIPMDMYDFPALRELNTDELIKFWTMVIMIIKGEGNADQPMEQLLRLRIHTLFVGVPLTPSSDVLAIVDGRLYIGSDLASPTALHGKVMEWKSGVGIDGIAFIFTGNSCTVHGWRNRGGFHFSTLGGGKLSTSRKTFQSDGVVSNIDDFNFPGVIVKAEIGFASIVDALLTSFPALVQVTVGTLLITTSTNGQRGESCLDEMHSVFQIDRQLVRSVHRHKFIASYTNIIFHHGLSWIRGCLSENLADLLPPRWIELESNRININSKISETNNSCLIS